MDIPKILVLVSFSIFLTAGVTGAGEVDSFEDGDMSEYQYFDCDSTYWTVTDSGPVKDGTYSLYYDTPAGYNDCWAFSHPGDGLSNYPEQGDDFEWWIRPGSGSSGLYQIYFGAQDDGTKHNQYEVEMFPNSDEFNLKVDDGGSETSLGDSTFDYTADQWYNVEIDWGTGGSITAVLKDSSGNTLRTLSGTDTTYTSGGLGIFAGGPEVYYDGISKKISTKITSPPNSTWQDDDFEVNITDSSSATSCEYQIYEPGVGWPAVWNSRTCDGTLDIDLSSDCPENGYRKCRVKVRASRGGLKDTETHFYHVSDVAVECGENATFCYPFDEGSGQTVFDYSEKDLHASMGKTFSSDSADPTWITDPSKCYRGNCLYFDKGRLTVRDDPKMDFDNMSFTGVVNISSTDKSPENVLFKGDEMNIVITEDQDNPYGYSGNDNNLSATIYDSAECATGWCGDDPVGVGRSMVVSDIQVPFDQKFRFRINYNGTHFGFFSEDETQYISPSDIGSYTEIEENPNDLLIGADGGGGAHLSGVIDEFNIYNSSKGGAVKGSFSCTSSQVGLYQDIGEEAELSGRIKNDGEFCAMYAGSSDEKWWDQDFGDLDGDGVQETCRTGPNTEWIEKEQVWDEPYAFTGGIDDDWTDVMQSFEDEGSFSHNESRPDDPGLATSGSDVSSVPTGVTDRSKIATIGFCAGDDEGEHLINQRCDSNLCETESDTVGVAESPDSCVLSPGVRGNTYSERRIFAEGEAVDLDIGPEGKKIACFDGVWYDKWPVALTQGSKDVELGGEQTINIKMINVADDQVTYKLSKEGEISRFVEFTGEASDGTVSVPAKSSKDISANLNGVKLGNDQDLTIQAVSNDGRITGDDTITVNTVQSSGGSTDLYTNIPGITVVEILFLFLASSLWFIVDF